jgi:integrase/recombinase XerD
MRNSNTFGIQFITRISNKTPDTGLIYARITVNKRRTEISIKRTVDLGNGM